MRKISPSLRFTLLLTVLVFALTACFRQADDSFQPVSVSDTNNTDSVTSPTSDSVVDMISTVDSSDMLNATTEAVDNGSTTTDNTGSSFPTQTPPLVVTVDATSTPIPFEEPTQEQAVDGSGAVEQPTEAFETPNSPSDPPLIASATPVVGTGTGLEPTATPIGGTGGLQATPTQFDPNNTGAGDGNEQVPDVSSPDDDGGVPEECTYTVENGDTVYRIAISTGSTVNAILSENPQLGNGNLIQVGQVLTIPDCIPDVSQDIDGEDTTDTAQPEPAPTQVTGGVIHVVSSGETVYSLARRYGVPVNDIINANIDVIPDPNRIQIGDELFIPGAEG